MDELYDAACTLLLNAEIIADPRMGGMTDVYAVPFDDIRALRAIVTRLRLEIALGAPDRPVDGE